MILHHDEVGVAPRNDQAECRQSRRGSTAGIIQPVGIDVPFEMVDPDERKVVGISQALRGVDADQQRSCEPRTVCYGDSAELLPANTGLHHSGVNDGNNRLQMLARCNLWHNATVAGVHLGLRSHGIRENLVAVFNNGRRRLVARCFYAEYQHWVLAEGNRVKLLHAESVQEARRGVQRNCP